MTKQQIRWAEQHNWFLESNNGEVIVRDEAEVFGVTSFTNFNKLKQWAGY